jgi:hypothetical protein
MIWILLVAVLHGQPNEEPDYKPVIRDGRPMAYESQRLCDVAGQGVATGLKVKFPGAEIRTFCKMTTDADAGAVIPVN